MDIMDNARAKRAKQSARKQTAERQVRAAEDHMRILRQELLDAERALQEGEDDNISTMEAPPRVRAKFIGGANMMLDHSDSSEGSMSGRSD
jgi:hypothetical protein